MNSLRHSAATKIEIEIEYLRKKLRVLVRDNGAGIDPPVLPHAQNSHGGLTGMQERAVSIAAKIRIWSKPGKGTEVEVSAPLNKLPD